MKLPFRSFCAQNTCICHTSWKIAWKETGEKVSLLPDFIFNYKRTQHCCCAWNAVTQQELQRPLKKLNFKIKDHCVRNYNIRLLTIAVVLIYLLEALSRNVSSKKLLERGQQFAKKKLHVYLLQHFIDNNNVVQKERSIFNAHISNLNIKAQLK